MSSNSFPVAVVGVWLTNALSVFRFAASSVPVPPVGVFFPVEKTTAAALLISVLDAAQSAEAPDPLIPVAVEHTRRSGTSVVRLEALYTERIASVDVKGRTFAVPETVVLKSVTAYRIGFPQAST